MHRSVFALLFAAALASLAAGQSSPPGRPGSPQPPNRLEIGIAHFEKAFYELTPRQRHAEASAELDLAVAALEGAVKDNPQSARAHTYLARVHAARKDFRQAAVHYDRVADIEPFNVDVCVLAALAYVDANEVAEARLRLVEGRRRTSDPAVLARLEEYNAKLDALKR